LQKHLGSANSTSPVERLHLPASGLSPARAATLRTVEFFGHSLPLPLGQGLLNSPGQLPAQAMAEQFHLGKRHRIDVELLSRHPLLDQDIDQLFQQLLRRTSNGTHDSLPGSEDLAILPQCPKVTKNRQDLLLTFSTPQEPMQPVSCTRVAGPCEFGLSPIG
jgi:hypothetical protein